MISKSDLTRARQELFKRINWIGAPFTKGDVGVHVRPILDHYATLDLNRWVYLEIRKLCSKGHVRQFGVMSTGEVVYELVKRITIPVK